MRHTSWLSRLVCLWHVVGFVLEQNAAGRPHRAQLSRASIPATPTQKRPSKPGQPSMAAQTASGQNSASTGCWPRSSRRSLLGGGSVSNRVKTLLTRFDLDNSGELEMDEFRSCLEDFGWLAGLRVRGPRATLRQ